MLDNIKPGSRVNVKVVKLPTNAAASKTIVRILSKDRSVRKENERLSRVRRDNWEQKRRGGRFWDNNVVKQNAVKPTTGVSKTVVASLDVLADLRSVSKFVEVTPA